MKNGVVFFTDPEGNYLHLLERAAEMGVDVSALPLRAGVFGADPDGVPIGDVMALAGGLAFAIIGAPGWEIIYVVALCALVLVRHLENIRRLIGRRELSANHR